MSVSRIVRENFTYYSSTVAKETMCTPNSVPQKEPKTLEMLPVLYD